MTHPFDDAELHQLLVEFEEHLKAVTGFPATIADVEDGIRAYANPPSLQVLDAGVCLHGHIQAAAVSLGDGTDTYPIRLRTINGCLKIIGTLDLDAAGARALAALLLETAAMLDTETLPSDTPGG